MIPDSIDLNQLLKKAGKDRYILDARGYMCPYPSMMTLKTLERIDSGEYLEVLIDNPTSCETIPQAVKEKGNEVVEIEKMDNGEYRIIIRKK